MAKVTGGELPSYSGPNQEVRHGRGLTRRALLTMGGLAASAGLFTYIDQEGAELCWPSEPMSVLPVPGAERLPYDGEEWIVFGGLGQLDSTNAAREFFASQGGTQVVSAVRYPTQDMDVQHVAAGLLEYIEQRQIKQLSIVGVSMGLPTFLMAWSELQRRAITSPRERIILPPIRRMVAYSSPFDKNDAWRGGLAHLVARSGYPGGLLGKLAYSLTDGPGDVRRLLAPQDLQHLWHHLAVSWQQTIDKNTPPQFFVGQLNILDQADLGNRWHTFEDAFMPNSWFAYCESSNFDGVVFNSAADKYVNLLKEFGVENTVITVPHSGHANSKAFAHALGPWLSNTAYTT